MVDQKPAEKPTVEIAKVPDWAIDIKTLVTRVSTNVDNIISAVDVIRDRVNAHDQRFADMDARATNVSLRVKGASVIDMEHEAKLAQALSALAEEKARREVLEQNSATKDDLKKVADAQTGDIIKSLTNAADKSPTVRNLMLAIAGLIFLGVNTATVYLTRPPPPPPPQPTSITVTK